MRGMLTARISEFLNTKPEPDDVAPPKHIVRQGQPHMLAYITPSEAEILRDFGGGVAPDGGQYMANGLPAFFLDASGAGQSGGMTGDAASDPGREAAAQAAFSGSYGGQGGGGFGGGGGDGGSFYGRGSSSIPAKSAFEQTLNTVSVAAPRPPNPAMSPSEYSAKAQELQDFIDQNQSRLEQQNAPSVNAEETTTTPGFIEQPTFEYSPYGILDTITPEAVQEAALFQFRSVKNAIGKKANVDPVLSGFIEVPGNFTLDKNTGMATLTEQGKTNMDLDRDEGGLGKFSMSSTADEGMTVAEVAMLGLENPQTKESVLLETTYSPLGVQASHVYANTQAGQRMGMLGTAFGMLAGGVPGAISTLAGVLEGSPITSGILGALQGKGVPGTQGLQDLTGQGLLDYMGWRSPEDKYGFAAPGAFEGGALEGLVDAASAGDFMGADSGSYYSAASGASPGPDLDYQLPVEEPLSEDDLAVVDPVTPDEFTVDPTTLATIPTDVAPVDLAGTYQPFTPSFSGATPVLTRELAAMFVPPGLQFGPLTFADGGPAVKKKEPTALETKEAERAASTGSDLLWGPTVSEYINAVQSGEIDTPEAQDFVRAHQTSAAFGTGLEHSTEQERQQAGVTDALLPAAPGGTTETSRAMREMLKESRGKYPLVELGLDPRQLTSSSGWSKSGMYGPRPLDPETFVRNPENYSKFLGELEPSRRPLVEKEGDWMWVNADKTTSGIKNTIFHEATHRAFTMLEQNPDFKMPQLNAALEDVSLDESGGFPLLGKYHNEEVWTRLLEYALHLDHDDPDQVKNAEWYWNKQNFPISLDEALTKPDIIDGIMYLQKAADTERQKRGFPKGLTHFPEEPAPLPEENQ
mgnify:CR=1 FL=1